MTRGIPWFPKSGDILTGTVKGYATGKTQFGVKPIAEIEEEETSELRTVWLSAAVLRNQFEQQAVTIGSSIGIEYSGKDPEKKYHLYSLIVYAEGDGPDYLSAMGLATPETEQQAERNTDGTPPAQRPGFTPHRRRRTDTELAEEATRRYRKRPGPRAAPEGFTSFYPHRTRPQEQPHVENDPFEW